MIEKAEGLCMYKHIQSGSKVQISVSSHQNCLYPNAPGTWLYAPNAGIKMGKVVQVVIILLHVPHQFMIFGRNFGGKKSKVQVRHMTKHKELTVFRWLQTNAVFLQWFYLGYGGKYTAPWKSSGFQIPVLEIFPSWCLGGKYEEEG